MKVAASQLRLLEYPCYYLYGADQDALAEAAEDILAAGDPEAQRLRVDVSELHMVEEESRNRGLFGPSICYALVRNAEAATPKQGEHLLKLAASVESGNRLIVCAPGVDWKKALHKKVLAMQGVGQCEFFVPDEHRFQHWFEQQLQIAGVRLHEDAMQCAVEQLSGLRLAARKFVQRLQWYDHGAGVVLDRKVVAALLGEHMPDELEDWCHAVAMRQTLAVTLAIRLLRDQQMAEVKMLAWLGTRMQQLLMYRWHVSKGSANPAQSARIFGPARKTIVKEADIWKPSELVAALHLLTEAEKRLKGASVEDKPVVMERLTLALISGETM
ncbi:MAG: DNA polymerase III subunit delta [Zetaproteobacteria bacterium CG_4_9_14_3_um_filter_49_83]|nr:MAG: DNA polymerase III subunit delta [Zetaproteobacteria bacterium CG1_02_49_23]PIQ31873.1 MAG: DNA polymerase III subunit delta [Zetaproteobacteria bacterium CG17_big_fil_post_rev_8_21_14_2_50_50_13]PIV29311.1 MAG: DNA polymerase III subunit delta [Zetaproteobacteria bacterium CG02_land_8_20_14_3_00_50_9]PIY55406.1 MAG: DNA polymerase III subunit delta [Zetaproteobacteria bacterium CG_4_10_14_0_8_um_filter_49_80]PJA34579.1 MAG: DNA polymerase III subunit delta [Zetaproteobacteria bacterium